ncbi:hypothetical protein ACEV6Q_04310 [Enterobacter ludwigii]|uniref:hypothetical protein n=1 Tax=Enterobacter ludwigii TaxID=299767 RepID=UPI003BEEBC2E
MSGNLKLDSNWDIIIGRGATRTGGLNFVTQNVKSRLLTLLGEWQQNKKLGLPWLDGMLEKDARISDIQTIVAMTVEGTPDVLSIVFLEVIPDYRTRQLTIQFVAESTYGVIESNITYGGK